MWNLLAQSDGAGDAAAGAMMAGFGLIYMVYYVALYIVMSYSLMTLANRMGIANSWMAWIPIANLYLLTQMAELEIMYFILSILCGFVGLYVMWKAIERAGKPGWSVLLLLVPCVNLGVPIWWLKQE